MKPKRVFKTVMEGMVILVLKDSIKRTCKDYPTIDRKNGMMKCR